jgi:hypothetical protein
MFAADVRFAGSSAHQSGAGIGWCGWVRKRGVRLRGCDNPDRRIGKRVLISPRVHSVFARICVPTAQTSVGGNRLFSASP